MTRTPSGTRRVSPMLAAFSAPLLLVAVVMALAYTGFRELSRANAWSIHTYQVLGETGALSASVAEMETAFRGFALTGDPRYAAAWEAAAAHWSAHLARARTLAADNPRQLARLSRLDSLHRAWLASEARPMAAAADPALRAAARAEASDAGGLAARRAVRQRISAELQVADTEEFRLLSARVDRARELRTRTELLILAGGILAAAVTAGAGWMVARRTAGLRDANRRLKAEAAERILARQAAERLARQNELILNAAAEGIYGVDAHGYTTFANPAAGRLLGVPADDLPGQPYEATLGLGAGDDPVRAALLGAGARTVLDASFRRADGRRFPVELTCTPIVEEGRIAGAVITFRDVTERREVDRMKDEFVSVVSHELRTPLTAIRGSLGLLAAGKAGELTAPGQRMLDIAVQNTDRLIRLINDILDLERIESGTVAMEPRPVSAAELAQNAAEVMGPMAERAGVSLYVWAEPVTLVADADRILQVLTNLVSNAVKFSPPGSSVEVTAEPEGEQVLFRVADHGRGIPADRLESIFGRFQQVDSSDSRQKGGTGLGLAICRTIVKEHGGRIWAESQPGQGSTFHFTLPLRGRPAPAADPAAAGADAESEADDGRRRVLVVEDDPGLAGVLAETLERRGVAADLAGTGEAAWASACRRRPDAVVLDIAMPEGDGYWVAERFRAHADLRDVPIVAYTALDLDEVGRERLRLMQVEVLTKSRVDPAELERRVLALIPAADGGDEARGAGPP